MAEYLLKAALQMDGLSNAFDVGSVGISAIDNLPATDLAIGAMRAFNPDIGKHVSRKATESTIGDAHAIFCMTEHHRQFLASNFKKTKKKLFLVKEFLECDDKNIGDPFFGCAKDYECVRDDINSAIGSILNFLKNGNET
jgi:protein-tyrosine-phosphatase